MVLKLLVEAVVELVTLKVEPAWGPVPVKLVVEVEVMNGGCVS